MKKLIIILLFAVTASTAAAQVSYNVKAGLNISSYISEIETKAKAGFKVGFGMEYAFNDMVSIRPTLMFATKGATGDIYSIGTTKVHTVVNELYLELPVMLGLRFNIGGDTNILLTAGPYFAYGAGGTTRIKGETGDYAGKRAWDTFDHGGIKRFDAGIGLGAAIEFGMVFVGIDSEIGLANLTGKSLINKKATNISIGLGAGYRF